MRKVKWLLGVIITAIVFLGSPSAIHSQAAENLGSSSYTTAEDNVGGKYVYFGKLNAVYRMNTETGNTGKICSFDSCYSISDVTYYDSYVYFLAKVGSSQYGTVYRCKIDGTKLKAIAGDGISEGMVKDPVIYNKKLFYLGGDSAIYKANLDGNSKTIILGSGCSKLETVINSRVYYIESSSTYLYSISTAGKDKKCIKKIKYSAVPYKNYLYFNDYASGTGYISRYNVLTGNSAVVYKYSATIEAVNGNYIYYSTDTSSTQLIVYNLSTKKKVTITGDSDSPSYSDFAIGSGTYMVFASRKYDMYTDSLELGVYRCKKNGSSLKVLASKTF